MHSVNVLVVSGISGESRCKIQAVSPRIKLWDTSHLWNAPTKVNDQRTKDDFSSPEFDTLLAQAEVMYGFRPPKNVTVRAPKLKWFQAMLAGVDLFLNDEIIRSPIVVTSTSGIHSTPVGEVALEMMLMLAKNAPAFFEQKVQKKWNRVIPEVLRSKTVGVVGLGHIGKEVARLSKAFGMRVLATRRSTRQIGRAKNVDVLLPRDQLPQLLSESDFVVLVLPNTPETRKMIGEKELTTMKPTAYLINVGRGETVDDDALIRAIEEKWIAGAGLDAFSTEPLPPTSRLWDLPDVIISPHVSGMLKNYDAVAIEVFCENLRRYMSGKKLLNVVNKKRGY